MRYLITLVLVLLLPVPVTAGTYEVALAGKKCKEGLAQEIECVFTIGKDLRIDIAGVGTDSAGATFIKSNFDGDYYATYGVLHGCIIVKPGKKTRAATLNALTDFAFISPRSAKVFNTWQQCQGQ
jgi:hypothetical protein